MKGPSSKSLVISVSAAVLVIVIAIAVAVYFSSSDSKNHTPIVRIGYLNIVASLPLFVAEEKGFLIDEGLEYEANVIATSNQLVDALIAGNLDFCVESSAVPVLAAELQSPGKMKIFSISEITSQAPFDALLVKEESPIESLADLEGKKIGVFPGSTATNLLKKYLSDQQVNVAGITFVPMPPANHLAGLLEGSVEAIHAYEPTTAIALARGGIRKLFGSVYAAMLSPNPQGVAVVSESFLQEYPDVASKVIAALERAMLFMKSHDVETRQILMKRMNLSQAVADRVVFLYMLPHSEVPSDILQEYTDMLSGLGELSGPLDVSGLLYRPIDKE